MAFQSVVMLGLLSVAGCALTAFLLLVFLYHRNEKRQKELLKQTRLDIADMTILFQTMRDIIGQQKALARQFNQAIEQKTAGVKTILAQSLAKNERLYEQQQALLGQIQEAQAQLQSIQRQMAYLDETVAHLKQSAPDGSVQGEEEIPPPFSRKNAPAIEPENPPSSASSESRPSAEEDMSIAHAHNAVMEAAVDEWRDLEVDASPPETEEEAPPEPVPEQIEDPQAARDAFRALLDMEISPASPHQGAHPPKPLETADVPPDGNGGKTMVVLQKRILEYSEAGMSVADISRELGIGKGEIRLMLSLAQQRRA